MHPELRFFLAQLGGAVTATLAPVVFIAFASMPWSLNGHPGEPVGQAQDVARHMT
jgi:hypothetical protein